MRFAIYVPCFGSSLGDPSVLVSLGVAAEEAEAGVTWMTTDGGARSLAELRSFVLAGPPR